MNSSYLFFDHASTTKCCEAAVDLMCRFAADDFGNPSSSHAYGQQAAKAIKDARLYFSKQFQIEPSQVIFTGSGSESDNLALYGVAMAALAARQKSPASEKAPRVICSAIEHPAVKKTAQSLSALGFDVQLAPVTSDAQIDVPGLMNLITPETILISIMRVNNIVGSILPVEKLATLAKEKAPNVIFHTDAVQAFGRVDVPKAPSPVDLVSVSAHKIEGPKGIGALFVLNKALFKGKLRPHIWGGEQEGGFRSGTQNTGLIAGFHAAAEKTLQNQTQYTESTLKMREHLRKGLENKKLLATPEKSKRPVRWNSPSDGVTHIVNLSIPGFPSGPLAKLLEERRCLISTGSACSSQKMEPDAVLAAMNLPIAVQESALRISFSGHQTIEDVDTLLQALEESIQLMSKLMGIELTLN